MPCGGIYPIKHHFSGTYYKRNKGRCYHCGKVIDEPEENVSFVEEWDAFIHRACIFNFLHGDEGKVVMEHGHVVCFGEEMA